MSGNLFEEFDALSNKIKQQCYRVIKCDDGFVIVYPHIDQHAVVSLLVSALSLDRVEYDLLRETPTGLMSAYCEVRSLIENWDGDYSSFPIPETTSDVLAEWYGVSEQDIKE